MKKLIIIFFILISIVLQAYDFRDVVKKERVEPRFALIIGNTNYAKLPHLKNPLNDARLMRETLKKSDFTVLYKENAKIRDMKKLLIKFAYKIKKGGIGLFYFAGHSVNVDGKNYLVGIDALLDNKDHISQEAISLNHIIKRLNNAHNRLNVLVSDTCRNTIAINTFQHNHFGRGVGKGLLAIPNTKGVFVAYSTASGELGRDGNKGASNGILTKYFVKNLKVNGASILEIFQHTRRDVYAHTDGEQSSSNYNQILKDFFFIIPSKQQKDKY